MKFNKKVISLVLVGAVLIGVKGNKPIEYAKLEQSGQEVLETMNKTNKQKVFKF